ERQALLLQAIVLELTLLLFGDAIGFDALLLGGARCPFFFTLALLVGLQLGLFGQALGLLLRAQLRLADFAVLALGNCQRSLYLDIDVGARNLDQIICEGVDEAVKNPLNV